jgi:hypothetical protein
MGTTVPATTSQSGKLTFCTGADMSSCFSTKTTTPFTVDTTGSEATITVQ